MKQPLAHIQELCSTLSDTHALVSMEKHGGALRNSYGNSLTAALPAAVFGESVPWSDLTPDGIFSTEAYTPDRGYATDSEKKQCLEDGATYLNKLGKKAILYAWFDTPPLHYVRSQLHDSVTVTRDEQIARQIEDKALLQTHFEFAGCPMARMPRHFVCSDTAQLPDYETACLLLGKTFVVQGRSMGGDGTKIVRSDAEYQLARQTLTDTIRASEFVDAPYQSVYVMSLPTRKGDTVEVYVDGPSHKPIDIAELGTGSVAGAGGDWRPAHDTFDAVSLTANVTHLAQYLYQTYGFYGHFVIEGFIRDGDFLFNEINARPGGGSEVNSDYQLQQDQPPFMISHILARLGLLHAEDLGASDAYNFYAQERATRGTPDGVFYLKYKNNGDTPVTTSPAYRGSGIYCLTEKGQLEWARSGITSRDASLNNNEILISNGPARQSALVASGKQICSLEGAAYNALPVFTPDRRLARHTLEIVRATQALFPGVNDLQLR